MSQPALYIGMPTLADQEWDGAVKGHPTLTLIGVLARGTAHIDVCEGIDVESGDVVAPLYVQGGANVWFGPHGVAVPDGLSVGVWGTADVQLYYVRAASEGSDHQQEDV